VGELDKKVEQAVAEDGSVQFTLDFLDPEKLSFERRENGTLIMHVKDSASYIDVRVRKAFPVTDPEHYTEICSKDRKYIGMVFSFSSLGEKDRELLSEELERSYVIPLITSITELKSMQGATHMEVITNRGPATLYIFRPHEDIKHLRDGRIRITDALDNIYEIRPWAIDAASVVNLQKLL